MQAKQKFYSTVMQLPVVWTLIQTFPVRTDDAYLDFIGDNKRADNTFQIKALYRNQFSEWERTKFGIHKDVSGLLYVPPQVLEQTFGTFRLDWNTIKAQQPDQYEGQEPFVVDRVAYQEPLYKSCVAVILHLKDMRYA